MRRATQYETTTCDYPSSYPFYAPVAAPIYSTPIAQSYPIYSPIYAPAPVPHIPAPSPVPAPRPTPVPAPVAAPVAQPINIVNNNNNVNTNTNPITISNPITVATVVPATPQHIVQYVAPATISCTIAVVPNSLSNNQGANLYWSSTGATRAAISDGIGAVQTSGSIFVHPAGNTSYVMTVWGTDGQYATCNTYVTVSGGAPYVSLSQIPYTGFDFGPTGNAIYWGALMSFAAAAGYLLVYYKGGMAVFAGALASAKGNHFVRSEVESTDEEEEKEESDAGSESTATPVLESRNTTDTMMVSHVNGMPRIVIARN
jgi:hypothetical protein